MRQGACVTAAVAVAALALTACGGADKGELGKARDRWKDADVSSYRLAVKQTCFCPPADRRISTSVVRDGKVVSRTGERLPATVEELFDSAEDAIDHADKADIVYDRRYGYPAKMNVDRDKDTTDDEFILDVIRFTPLTTPS
jgi:Family of unknown function (DUF6174)